MKILTPRRFPKLRLRAELTVPEAFSRIALAALARYEENAAGALRSEDPGYVHQARVALRRLRAALVLFADTIPDEPYVELDARARRVAAALGAARDWDVFVLETLGALDRAAPRLAGFEELVVAAEIHRVDAREAARARVGSPRTLRWLAAFAEAARVEPSQRPGGRLSRVRSQPLMGWASGALERRWRAAHRLGKHQDRLSTEGLHDLRLEIKKLRYASDMLGSLFSAPSVEAMTAKLAEVQGALGVLGDTETARRHLKVLRSQARTRRTRELSELAIEWTRLRARHQEIAIRSAWDTVRAVEPFWR